MRRSARLHLRQLFADDPERGQKLALEAVGIYFDYSKNRITDETLRLLVQLAEESGVGASGSRRCSRGERINTTENRPVLHVALRAPRDSVDRRRWRERRAQGARGARQDGGLLPSACAAASGRGTRASGSRTSSTSASAAPTWGR